MQHHHRKLVSRACSVLFIILLLGGCREAAQPSPLPSSTAPVDGEIAQPAPLSTPIAPTYEITLTELPLEEALPHFQDDISQEMLTGIDDLEAQGMNAVHTLRRFGVSDDNLTSGTRAIIEPGQALEGYLLIVNTEERPLNYGLLATVDYEAAQVAFNGEVVPLPTLHLKPDTRRAFHFSLPALSEGLHSFVITYIVEPHRFMVVSSRAERPPDPIQSKIFGNRDAPTEVGLLILATAEAPKTVEAWPRQAREIEPGHTVLTTRATLQKKEPGPDESEWVWHADQLRAGEDVTRYLKFGGFYDNVGSTDTIPIRVLVWWDDLLTQTDELEISVTEFASDRYLPYTIHVPTYLYHGPHTLTVVTYPYPYYLRSWKEEGWEPNAGFFSHLAARVNVFVESDLKLGP